MLEAYAVSDPGKVRAENQDAWRIVPELGLYLLADGMGGARGGERASCLAVDSVTENLRNSTTRDAAALLHAIEEANERVLSEASRDPKLDKIARRNFSTTVELREGQTLSVAGLIQNNMSTSSNRVPFWGDLPIIGPAGASITSPPRSRGSSSW